VIGVRELGTERELVLVAEMERGVLAERVRQRGGKQEVVASMRAATSGESNVSTTRV
jgi:hypothetical protein